MNKSSIFYSITFIFIIAVGSIFVAFLYLLKYDKEKYTDELNRRYTVVAKTTLYKLLQSPIDKELESELKEYGMIIVDQNSSRAKEVLKTTPLQKISSKLGISAIYFYDRENYLFIKSANNKSILLRDRAYQSYRYQYIMAIFGLFCMILLITYLMTIKKLKPIKKIKQEIDKFANGDLNIDCKTDEKDEISEVSNAFYYAVEEIKKLNNSKRLFLRNVMHELKTPIAKGMISAEMLPDSKQKSRLIAIFARLETLLNEFIAIERITTGNRLIKKSIYRLVDIIDEAVDISLVEKDLVKLSLQKDLTLKVDFKLFSIAIKNMIDNGIKHSIDKSIQIVADSKKIEFISKGLELKHQLEYYIEPFTKGENSSTSDSFGLGLYIVDNILKAHNLTLSYEYRDGYNIFKFEGIQPII